MNKIITNQEKNAPISNGVKLNLGCGKEHKEGYINIDIQEPCDLRHDLRTPWPFDDGSVDEIFTEDTVRIFSLKEWEKVKKEMARVLKPGGKLEIIFPDFEYILNAFLKNEDGRRWSWWWRVIFGSQENDEYRDICKNSFTYKKLLAELFKKGMINFKKQRLEEQPGYIHLTCHKQPVDYKMPHSLRVLIGVPIHINYPIEKCLGYISKLKYRADLLMVDTSSGLGYLEKVNGYCAKYGIKNYKIEHLEINQEQGEDERIGRSREIIRQYVLSHNYDAWFSVEYDNILPANALDKLVGLMEEGNFMMVFVPALANKILCEPTTNFGCALIRRECFEKHGFLSEYDAIKCWHGVEVFFKKRFIKSRNYSDDIYEMV
ncbi:MAG: methyltransferase domain-containing protein [Parcubacteria group bacterium]|nr:methyltransferase domain-containing protein [Parcubacteria group bacterium]